MTTQLMHIPNGAYRALDDPRLKRLWTVAAAANQMYADSCARLTAETIHQFLPTADRLVFQPADDEDGSVELLMILGQVEPADIEQPVEREVLWFDANIIARWSDEPAAALLGDLNDSPTRMSPSLHNAIERPLQYALQAHPDHFTTDPDLSVDRDVYVLDLNAAIAADNYAISEAAGEV